MKTQNVFGALDMGGASAEVTFLDQSSVNSTETYPVKLYGKPYNLYSHSYMCYGKSEAEYRFLAYLTEVRIYLKGVLGFSFLVSEKRF